MTNHKDYNDYLILRGELTRNLGRSDTYGLRERRAAADGLLAALNTIERLCRDDLTNLRYLRAWTHDRRDDETIAILRDESPASDTIDALMAIIYQDSRTTTAQRLKHKIMPTLNHEWEVKNIQEEMTDRRFTVVRVTWDDDINRTDLQGYMLQARCGKCGQTFVPDSQSFIGLNSKKEGLYEHYLTIQEDLDGSVDEVECGGMGIIEGGYRGLNHKLILRLDKA